MITDAMLDGWRLLDDTRDGGIISIYRDGPDDGLILDLTPACAVELARDLLLSAGQHLRRSGALDSDYFSAADRDLIEVDLAARVAALMGQVG